MIKYVGRKNMKGIAKRRIEWIDIAKAFGIILVVLAHSLSKDNFLWRFINQFHMPFFFAISGFLYSTKGTIYENIKKKILTLYIPYISCSFLTQIVGWIVGEAFSIKKIIKILFLMDWGPLLGATWFLAVLFYAILIYDAVVRICTKFKLSQSFITCFAVICLIIGLCFYFPIRLNNILLAIFYINFGKLLKEHYSELFDKTPVFRRIGEVLFVGAVSLISVFNTSSFASNTFSSKVCFVIASILGTFGMMSFAYGFSEICRLNFLRKHLCFIGSHTIGIVIWQFVAFKIVSILQICFYHLPLDRIYDYPIIYDYSFGPWVFLLLLSGIYISILIHYLLSFPVKKVIGLIKS